MIICNKCKTAQELDEFYQVVAEDDKSGYTLSVHGYDLCENCWDDLREHVKKWTNISLSEVITKETDK